MMIPKRLFTQKKYDKAMDEYTKGLYGIPTGKKAAGPAKMPAGKKASKKARKK